MDTRNIIRKDKMTSKTQIERWEKKDFAEARSNRTGAFAPREKELGVYEKLLKASIKGKKSPIALILGATPELRDLAIKNGCQTIAVDVSWKTLVSLTAVMENADDPNNRSCCYDWLETDQIFKEKLADVVLADASLNNLKAKDHALMFRILHQVLKDKGSFITRNLVRDKNLDDITSGKVQEAYEKNELEWSQVLIYSYFLWQEYTEIAKNEFSVGKMLEKLSAAIKSGQFKIRKSDLWKIANVEVYGPKIVTTILPKKDFEKKAKQYFRVGKVVPTPSSSFTIAPIYRFVKV